MKNSFAFAIIAFVFTIVSCNQPKAPVITPENANLTIHFNNKISGSALYKDSIMYTNASGNLFSVHLLKYFITNIILLNENGTEVKLNNYDLIDAFDANFSNVFASAIPNGNYTSMKFLLGVDSSRNHTGAQDGDLDPSLNMFWNWSTGYIFFKHEGDYKNSGDSIKPLLFHLGSDSALASVQIPIGLNINGASKTMNINFDLAKMYNSPLINFNTDDNHMSTLASDKPWMDNMISNTNDAFTFESVQ